MQGNPSPSSVAGLEVQKREIIQEIQNCKSKLALLNEEYAKLSKKQQVARERDAQSPILQKNLLHELLKNPKRRSDSNQQKLNKSPTNTLFQGPREMVVEQFSRLRMVNVKVTNAEFGDRMKNRRYIKMDEIERLMIDGDIPGDFVIIGILVHQKTLILEDTTIKVLLLSDLHQNYVRVFLVADALTKEFTNDSIIAILNPQILIPSKRAALIGLITNSPTLCMTLGTSIDHGWCSATSKHCLVVINTVKESYCADHRLELYHSARIKRQEFAGGLNQVQQGAPTDKTKKKHINRGIKCMVHYNINSLVLAAEGLDCQLREKPKPTSQQCTTQEIEVLKRSNLPGAKNIRLHFGFKEEETDVNVFGAEALARMGCNPFNKNDVIPSSKLTPKKTQSDASSVEGTPTRLGKRTLKPTNLGEKTKKGKTEETIELEFSDSD